MSHKKGTLLACKVPFQEAQRVFSKHVIICLHSVPSRISPPSAILQVKKQAQNGSWNSPRTQRDSQDRCWAPSPQVLLSLEDRAALVLLSLEGQAALGLLRGGSDPGHLARGTPVTRGHRIPALSSRNAELCSFLRTAVCSLGEHHILSSILVPKTWHRPVNGALQVAASGTRLVVQRLRRHTSTAGSMGSLPGQRTKVLRAAWYGQRTEKREKENTPFRQE